MASPNVSAPPGGLTKIGSDPMKAVKDVAEESSNFFSVAFRFAANLIAPEEDEGMMHTSHKAITYIRKGFHHHYS